MNPSGKPSSLLSFLAPPAAAPKFAQAPSPSRAGPPTPDAGTGRRPSPPLPPSSLQSGAASAGGASAAVPAAGTSGAAASAAAQVSATASSVASAEAAPGASSASASTPSSPTPAAPPQVLGWRGATQLIGGEAFRALREFATLPVAAALAAPPRGAGVSAVSTPDAAPRAPAAGVPPASSSALSTSSAAGVARILSKLADVDLCSSAIGGGALAGSIFTPCVSGVALSPLCTSGLAVCSWHRVFSGGAEGPLYQPLSSTELFAGVYQSNPTDAGLRLLVKVRTTAAGRALLRMQGLAAAVPDSFGMAETPTLAAAPCPASATPTTIFTAVLQAYSGPKMLPPLVVGEALAVSLECTQSAPPRLVISGKDPEGGAGSIAIAGAAHAEIALLGGWRVSGGEEGGGEGGGEDPPTILCGSSDGTAVVCGRLEGEEDASPATLSLEFEGDREGRDSFFALLHAAYCGAAAAAAACSGLGDGSSSSSSSSSGWPVRGLSGGGEFLRGIIIRLGCHRACPGAPL